MKILVTGGAGFIGSHVVDAYIDAGHEVVVVDNLSTGKKENLNPKAVFYNVDISDKALEDVFIKENFDIINHHAAQIDVRKSVADPVFDAQVNIIGLLNVLQNAVKYGAVKIINISSGGVIYGDDAILPIKEETSKGPISAYGISKLTGEYYVNFFQKLHGLKFTTLRYSNVYGPRQNPEGEAGVVAIFSKLLLKGESPTIFGNGRQTRDYVYVKDVVKANLLAIKNGDNQVFNIGTSKEVSVNELAKIMKSIVSFQGEFQYSEPRPGELLRNSLDCSKAQQKLGWKPSYELETGLKETIEWIKN